MSTWTPERLAKLENAIAKGITSVQYEDRRIQYRSLTEMMQIRDTMKAEIDGGKGKNKRRRRLCRHNKGL